MANHDNRIAVCNGSHSQVAQLVHVSPGRRFHMLDPIEKVLLLTEVRLLVKRLKNADSNE
jgi:hypothetical protein